MRLICKLAALVVLGSAIFYFWPKEKKTFESKPLLKYSFPTLRETVFLPDGIWVDKDKFYFWVWGKKVSGKINIPQGQGPFPVVIMIRGYVDREIYRPGIGTQRAAEVFAQNGYMTLAPDFLGYGESDMPPNNSLEERFLTPVTILQLIASLKNLHQINPDKIYLWAHSNGGQIALSVLEIYGRNFPAVLWAPVSKPFPYSILYYTDEYEDYGKALRKVLAAFDVQYDADEFSVHKFYNWIQAPIQIHQGMADELVPLKWSQELEQNLKKAGKEVKLYVYENADHNLQTGWNLAVERSLNWFSRH